MKILKELEYSIIRVFLSTKSLEITLLGDHIMSTLEKASVTHFEFYDKWQ